MMKKSTLQALLPVVIGALLVMGSAMAEAAEARFDAKKQKWGLVDDAGEWKVKPQFTSVEATGKGFIVHKNEKSGYYNSQLEEVAKVSYDKVAPCDNGFVLVEKDGKWGVVTPFGKVSIKPKYDTMAMTARNTLCVTESGKAGIVNTQGDEVMALTDKIRLIEPFNYNYVKYHDQSGRGLLSQGGGVVVPSGRYDEFAQAEGDRIYITQRGKTGMLDGNAREVIVPRYDSLKPWNQQKGLYFVGIGSHVGLCDEKGDEVVASQFDSVEPVAGNDDRYIVTKDGLKGLYGGRKLLLPNRYSSLNIYPGGNRLKAEEGGLVNIFDINGAPIYKNCVEVGNGLRAFSNNDTKLDIVDAAFNFKAKDFPGHVELAKPLILLKGKYDEILTPNGAPIYKGKVSHYAVSDDNPYCTFFVYDDNLEPIDGSFYIYTRSADKVREVSYRQLIEDDLSIDSLMSVGITRLLPAVSALMPEDMRADQIGNRGQGSIEECDADPDADWGGVKGLEVSMNLTVEGVKGKTVVVEVLFYDKDGSPLAASSAEYAGSMGQMAVQDAFVLEDNDGYLFSKELFIPLSELRKAGVTDEMSYRVVLRAGSKELASRGAEHVSVAQKPAAKAAVPKKKTVKKLPAAGVKQAPKAEPARRKGH